MNKLDFIEQPQLRRMPQFQPGDTVKVQVRVVEGDKERLQAFQGVVIRRQGGGLRETFTVRKISFGVGVERTFPVHSPSIAKVEILTKGHVRRAKLYYLRELRGKKARIKERRDAVIDEWVDEEPEEEFTPELAEEEAPATEASEAAEAAPETEADAPAEAPEAADEGAEEAAPPAADETSEEGQG